MFCHIYKVAIVNIGLVAGSIKKTHPAIAFNEMV